MPRNAAILICTIATASLLSGCKSSPPPAESEPFISEYRTGSYEEAYRDAEAKYNSSEAGLAKDRAALMAGLSAYALRRPEKAQTWLDPLVANPDPEVAGTAGWTMGMIAADRGNYVRSAALASAAAAKLKADDAAKARLLAGEAYARLGRTDQAREQYAAGLEVVQSPPIKAALDERLAGRGPAATTGVVLGTPAGGLRPQPKTPVSPAQVGQYVIQMGAFSVRSKAEQALGPATAAASKAGQPAPRIVATSDPKTGAALYAVQVGSFSDRAGAEAALLRMGVAGTVMMAHR